MEGKREKVDEIRWTGEEAVMKWNDKGRMEEKTRGEEEDGAVKKGELDKQGKDNIEVRKREPGGSPEG